MLKDDFPDDIPDVLSVIRPGRGRGKVSLLEPYVILEARAAPEKKNPFQSVSTCSDIDATQFDTPLAKQEEALKQVGKENAVAEGFPKDAVENFDQQQEAFQQLELEKENRDRDKVAQTPNIAPIPRATLPPSQFDRQHSAGSLGRPFPTQPHPSHLAHPQSEAQRSGGQSQQPVKKRGEPEAKSRSRGILMCMPFTV